MRALAIHETVMQLMVNTLNKAQHQTAAAETVPARNRSSVASTAAEIEMEASKVCISYFLKYTIFALLATLYLQWFGHDIVDI